MTIPTICMTMHSLRRLEGFCLVFLIQILASLFVYGYHFLPRGMKNDGMKSEEYLVTHCTWIPNEKTLPEQGVFCVWIEYRNTSSRKQTIYHPGSLRKDALQDFLEEFKLNIFSKRISKKFFLLPTIGGIPTPSAKLLTYHGEAVPEKFAVQSWSIDCWEIPITKVEEVLDELNYLTTKQSTKIALGYDSLFWRNHLRLLRSILIKDQFIPSFAVKSGTNSSKQVQAFWEIVSDRFETAVQKHNMPFICSAGFCNKPKSLDFHDQIDLLRHFSEAYLNSLVRESRLNQKLDRIFSKSIFDSHLFSRSMFSISDDVYLQWLRWRDQILKHKLNQNFHIYFQLQAPKNEANSDDWYIEIFVSPKADTSDKRSIADYWNLNSTQKVKFTEGLGDNFEQDFLLSIGLATRIYPDLWKALDNQDHCSLNLDQAYSFLKNEAWTLQDAGYRVVIPSWYTPEGRQKAKIRMKVKKAINSSKSPKSYLSFDSLVNYDYHFSLGSQEVSQREWARLMRSKAPLINYRGQWVELDKSRMQKMVTFIENQDKEQMTLLDLMQFQANNDGEFDFELDSDIDNLFSKLNNKHDFTLIDTPPGINGELRAYQKRGLSWLSYLEEIGLNPCLADDMGLGKTIQIISRIMLQKEQKPGTTLLIAPTSVIGNWQKEIQKFAPSLNTSLHHGSKRNKDTKEIEKLIADIDIFLTTFALVRKDFNILKDIHWDRIVLDEAQNIKNPNSAQTKAILKLKSTSRIALTGTPLENRLLDLWSIFNFLNPEFLGNQTSFRKKFEIPIQKNSNIEQANILRQLTEPFILRRLKTDKSIIKDLPDKIEQKVYCNLTREQASLYESVVKDVTKKIEKSEGIERKGLILSTLLKLKQICNHPAQFLQDMGEFTKERSQKLTRLNDMVREIIDNGESLLIFSQYTEICSRLEDFMKENIHFPTYYIHGQTSRTKREQIIDKFQDADSPPAVFILSLKAGGVGITLTKANHVFHFDRWWNPAVEDQATDRAFRIGQSKNVFVHKFISIGTIEEKIDAIIEDKKSLKDNIIGNDESWLTEIDNDTFKNLIKLKQEVAL